MNINEFQPTSGRFVKEDGTTVNIADALGDKSVSDKVYDIDNMMPHSGRFIKEDGTTVNIADMIANGDIGGGGGSDSGSSDDSAPPIVETYNGQTIQCSMSADRPLQGLNLYATCKQKTTTGAQLFDASKIPSMTQSGATLTNNGDGSVTFSGEGELTNDFNISINIPINEARQFLKEGYLYTNGSKIVPIFYCFVKTATNKITTVSGKANITTEVLDEMTEFRVVFSSPKGTTITPGTFWLMMWQDGDGTYEPYTGRIPSPNAEYPQEIQTISDFVVEVKNSMGEDATPQTLNIVIPDQGFYGIPVSSGGNYTDTDGQQWICDEFDFANKKFIKRTGRIEFDGSSDENWILMDAEEETVRFCIKVVDATNEDLKECFCNRAIYGTSVVLGKCFFTARTFYINVDPSLNSLELWRQYLSTHELDVIYQLETPTEYNLTDEQVEQFKKLKSYYGTTYIDNDAVPACNMQAELVLDTKLYIDNKFTTLAGQILEMGV